MVKYEETFYGRHTALTAAAVSSLYTAGKLELALVSLGLQVGCVTILNNQAYLKASLTHFCDISGSNTASILLGIWKPDAGYNLCAKNT